MLIILLGKRSGTAHYKIMVEKKINLDGGALALGHPLGGTGSILTTKAVHELHRSGGEHALVTMCCGGGLGTGTLIQKI